MTVDESFDKLVMIAESHHQRTQGSDASDHEKARRARALELARSMRDAADDSTPAISFLQVYLDLINVPLPAPPAPTEPTPYLPDPVDWDELRRGEFDDEDYLVEPFIVRGRAHAIYAPAKTGKSLLILEAVIALATGTPFLRQPAGEPIDIVYLDYEMTRADLRARVDAMQKLDSDLVRLHYYLIPALDPLDTSSGGAQVETIVARHKAALIVIDTTSRAIAGEENSADTLRALYRHTGARLKAQGITVLRVDHAGKNLERGQRGTSAKNDDVDIVWQLTGAGDRLTLKCTHQRVGFLPAQIDLQRTQEPLAHKIIEHAWPAGTAEMAANLDKLGLPVDIGRQRARTAIAEWNDANPLDRIEATARTIEAAIRYRKSGQQRQPLEALTEAA